MFAKGRALLRRNETLVTIYIQTALATLGFGLIGPVLPLYARSFEVSIFMVGLLVTAVGVVRVILDVPMGRLSDRFGRRPLVIFGLAIMSLGSLGGALAGSFGQLMVARVMWGLGSAACLMSLQVMLTDVSTASNRGRVLGLFHGSFQVGHGMGPAIGGFIAYYYGLSAPFFAYSAVALIATLWAILRLRETKKPISESVGINAGSSTSKGKNPSILKQLLGDTSFLLISFMALTHAMSRTGTNQMMLPILATEQVGINIGQLGLALTLTSMVHLSTIFLGGWISDHFGRKRALVPGYLIVALGLIIFALSHNYWVFLSGAFVMGLGRGISGPIVAYVADLAPEGHYGKTLGLYHTFNDMGMVIGPLILGWLADNRGLGAPFYFDAALLTFAALIFGLFARETVLRRKQEH